MHTIAEYKPRKTTVYLAPKEALSTASAMDNNARAATISGRAWACAIRFQTLIIQARQTTPAVDDQLARFNIWAANIGVFAEAHASLDYRLRNSPKVRAMMLLLLQALKRKLQFGAHLRRNFCPLPSY